MKTISGKITLKNGNIIELNQNNLIDINREIFSRSDMRLPSWGIISNKGSITFNDINDIVLGYAENLLLESNLKVELFFNNPTIQLSTKIATMQTDTWEYDNNSKLVEVTIKDNLEEWQNILIKEIVYDPRKKEHKPFKDLYNILYEKTPQKYNMINFSSLDEQTKNILETTMCQFPYLENSTLWRAWEKLCEALQCQIYKNNEGKTIFIYSGGD